MDLALALMLNVPAGSPQADEGLFGFVGLIYLICVALVAVGVFLAAKGWKLRKRVLVKHTQDNGKLEDWDRAIKYVYSGDEGAIKTGLDLLWALSNPVAYAEIKPIVDIFSNHQNAEIALRAKQILSKQLDALSSSVGPDPTRASGDALHKSNLPKSAGAHQP